jgi:O-antigen/teichoic acid export membrane protein
MKIKGLIEQLRSPLYNNSVYILANQLLNGISGLIFWLLAAHWYSANDIGIGSATISAMTLLNYLSFLGLDYAVMRFLSNAGDSRRVLINSGLMLGIVASIVAGLIFITGLKFWSPYLSYMQNFPAFMALFVVCVAGTTSYYISARIFIGLRQAKFSLFQGIIFNILRLGMIIALAGYLSRFGIFISWGIAGIAAVFISIFFFLPKIQPDYRATPLIRWPVVMPVMRFALSNYIISLFWFGAINIMPLLVVNLLGEKENAYFFIGWQIMNILLAIPIAISFALLAEGSHDPQKLRINTRRSFVFTLAIVITSVILILLLANHLLGLFGVPYAENGATMLRWAVLSAIPVSLNQIYFGVQQVKMKMKNVIFINAFTMIGALGLSYFLLQHMGITGAGIAWLIVHSIASIIIGGLWIGDIQKLRKSEIVNSEAK